VKPKLSIITLGVADLEESVAFYGRLGWFPVDVGDAIAFFDLGGVRLALFPRPALADDAGLTPGLPLEPGRFPGFTLAHNEPTPEAVDAAFAEAVAAGATPVKDPVAVFWGGYSGYVADPDGFLWEIAYNPYTDLT